MSTKSFLYLLLFIFIFIFLFLFLFFWGGDLHLLLVAYSNYNSLQLKHINYQNILSYLLYQICTVVCMEKCHTWLAHSPMLYRRLFISFLVPRATVNPPLQRRVASCAAHSTDAWGTHVVPSNGVQFQLFSLQDHHHLLFF
jgi:hypothetical protein